VKVVVKKNVLFNLLKASLSESRSGHSDFYSDGSFLGRFEEKEEEIDYLNSDVPLRASPTSSTQLHMKNFDVSDPEYLPASKSGFLAAAAAILEHVPDSQIEFAYERLHKLLDTIIEKEDERNYGSLKETFKRLFLNESREYYLKNAAKKVRMGEDAIGIAQDMIDMYAEFENEDAFELGRTIEDISYADAGFDMTQATTPAPVLPADNVRTVASRRPRRVITKKQSVPEQKPDLEYSAESPTSWDDYTSNDITGADGRALAAATSKEEFVLGYNDASKDTTSPKKDKRDMSGMNPDYIDGYERGYKEFSGEVKPYSFESESRPNPRDLLKQQEASIKISRANFGDPDLPAVLKLIPELYLIIKEIGFKLEVDRYNLMMSGDSVKQADANIRQVYNISHLESFIYWNMMKAYFNKDYALRSFNKHFNVIMSSKYVTNETRIFKKGFSQALKTDGLDEEQGIELLSQNFVAKILDDVSSYNYEPDKDKHLKMTLRNTFSTLVSYFQSGKGVDQKSAEGTKNYQANNSFTFANNVKEEYREDIISDFLDALTEKYLVNNVYKVKSGRKLPNNPKKNEYYEYDPIEVNKKATTYANDIIDDSLKAQADGTTVDIFSDEKQENEGILDNEDSPDEMTDEEISQKLSNTSDFQTLAPFFGFSGAPGMRQWFLKFAKRFFEMGIISAKSGDRTLIKFHSQMVEAVLETLNENLPELANLMLDEIKDVSKETQDFDEQSRLLLVNVLLTCAKQIDEAFQTFLDTGDELHSTMVSGKSKNGEVQPIPFLDSLGGQLTRSVNGMFFKKVLTRLDRSWTDYVAEQLQTNKQFINYIADNISNSANIDVKAAKSVAEYFIGKKNAPTILTNRVGTKTERVYKTAAKGNPSKGVKTLMKYGIDADAYHIINIEAQDWFEDMLMTDFAKVLADGEVFKGQYRELIEKDYAKLSKNIKSFKTVVLTALQDVIVGSEERMAMDQLKDYEVES